MATVEKIAQENYLNDYTLGDTFKAWAYNYLNKFRFKKNALGKRIRVEYQKKIKIDNIKDLMKAILAESNRIGLESKLGYGNFFVVCSVKTGLALQMHSEYTMAPIPGDGTFSPTYGMPYSIGKIAGMTIYVDPYMLFQDTNVYIGCKTPFKYPGIKIFFFADGITNEMVVKGIGAPKMILKVRYALVPVGESANLLYRKIEYQDKFKLKFK